MEMLGVYQRFKALNKIVNPTAADPDDRFIRSLKLVSEMLVKFSSQNGFLKRGAK